MVKQSPGPIFWTPVFVRSSRVWSKKIMVFKARDKKCKKPCNSHGFRASRGLNSAILKAKIENSMLPVGWNLATEPCRIAGVVQNAKTYQKMCENLCRLAHVVNNVRKTQVKLQVFGNMCQTWQNMCKNHCKLAHFVENASNTQVNLHGFAEHFANLGLQQLKQKREMISKSGQQGIQFTRWTQNWLPVQVKLHV